mmetsp:Transcript_14422/g.27124  ORF Transcript_14422/g.27124 Transcript_14422/m.27124 type:complete len:663 (-) Transcript_14422:1748-3736(-)|eukprot:CAMPEP_0176483230 /NCGR_PEP_ID=MMETSP0200_2-20121128/3808_1 /TAXON_ID=947934 /ORGANISM="Chaetoceros sp., Strain GSL56" /LENGTH=662 /DNA_ID=CAMNT_0017879619 /DNA_START=1035 /DNA_END=3023 /DNA_ORIENTATION=+
MDFLYKAQASYYRISCQAIRSVLYECAAEALRQIVESRRIESWDGEISNSTSNSRSRIVITQQDIEESYKFTRKIGRRWADKLFMMDDESTRQVMKMIKLVLENGEFLNEFYRDDFIRLLERPDDECSDGGGSSSSDDCSDDLNLESRSTCSFSSNQVSSNNHPSRIRQDRDKSLLNVVGQNPCPPDTATRKLTLGIQKSIPHATLLHVGQLDSCNLNAPKELLQQGIAAEWKPLPTLSNPTSLVHLPNPIFLPQEEIEQIHDNQLYGRPALQMPPRMNVREQISMIDQLATEVGNGDGRKQTMWPCDWSVIQRQAERNRERLYPTRIKKEENGEGDDEMIEIIEVVPKCLLANDDVICDNDEQEENQIEESSAMPDTVNQNDANGVLESNNDINQERNVEEFASGIVNNDGPLMTVETRDGDGAARRLLTHGILSKTWIGRKRKRKCHEVARNNQECQRGANDNSIEGIARGPSTFGHMEWTIQEIKEKIGKEKMEELDNLIIHRDDESSTLINTCHGFLKTVGNIHLFEQCRVGQWRGYMDDILLCNEEQSKDNADKTILKRRKTAHRKAKRQRLYPNYELGTKGYHESKLQSKILRVNQGIEGLRPRQYNYGDEQDNQCMEMDLGECTLSVIVPSESDCDCPTKRIMAFRSVEISLSGL